ncbi:MAG: plasmid mobilization relaxosome protein MobC [Cyclobacteriaceae bacterium]
MARPRKDDRAKRLVQVNIRLTTEESLRIEDFAKASGLSPANWIRQKVFTGKFPTIKQSPLDISIYQQLRKIGVNLNQATHQLNRGEFPKDYRMLQLELVTLLNKTIKNLLNDGNPD